MPRAALLFDVSLPRRRDEPRVELLETVRRKGLPEPETEYRFASVALGRNWAFDYAWPDPWRIALEVEGAMFGGRVINVGVGAFEYRTIRGRKTQIPVKAHSVVRLGGRHNTGAGLVADIEKYNAAAMLGWMVLKATTTQVRDDQVGDLLDRAFRMRWNTCRLPATPPPIFFETPAAAPTFTEETPF